MNGPGIRWTKLRWNTDSITDARAWVAVLSVLLSISLAAAYWIARAGFDNPVRLIVLVVGLGLWLTATPFILHLILRTDERQFSWLSSESFLSLCVLAVTALLGWLAPRVGLNVFPLLAILGGASCLWLLIVQFGKSPPRRNLWFICATLLLTAWIAGVEWANGFLSPLLVENVILHGGTAHVDTWYLSSIANMVQLHGVPSVGLDGVAPVAYHYGSGWLFAQLANVSGLSVLQFYTLGVPVVIIPLFFRGILVSANDIRAARKDPTPFSLHSSPLLWLILGAATIGALPPSALHSVGIWASGPLLSESYVSVITLCLFVIATVACYWRDADNSATPALFFLLFVPLSIGAIGVVKVSQMLLLLALAWWFFLRGSMWRKLLPLLSIVATTVVALLVYRYVVTPERSNGIAPLTFMRFLPKSWWIFFPFLHLFWTWVYSVLRLQSIGVRTFAEFKTAFSANRIRDVEFVVLLALIGLVPGNVFDISSDQYYFSDFQRWVSLTLLLGSPLILDRVRPSLNRKRLLLAPFALTMVVMSLTWGARFAKDNLATRREVQSLDGTLPTIGLMGGGLQRSQLAALADQNAIARVMRSSPRYPVVTALQEISNMSWTDRSQAIVFVQPDVSEFWKTLPNAPLCVYSPMLAPAIAGVPILAGIPPGCKIPVSQIGNHYQESAAWALQADAPDELVCALAVRKGFSYVIRVSPGGVGRLTSRTISCES